MSGGVAYTVVIATTGRECLGRLLDALDKMPGKPAEEVIVVDDRKSPQRALLLPVSALPVRVVTSGGRGPAAARNVGWQRAHTEWVAFLDDDVVPGVGWAADLQEDLADLPEDVAASQARINVPHPAGRAPTDLERTTAGLATAWWITADMAYRRSALLLAGGFDEQFPRAYREDADLAMRVRFLEYRIVAGRRQTVHPVRPAGFFASVRAQAGNADNALLRRKYGPHWRRRIGEGAGRTPQHVVTTAAALVAVAVVLPPYARRRMWRNLAAAGTGMWCALTAGFAVERIKPGPRTVPEVTRMIVTSALIPPVACWHRARGELRQRRGPRRSVRPVEAVLFDRDDTLIDDVPYNGDPMRVRPKPGVREALRELRRRDVALGVVSNQSGVARGLLDHAQVAVVNAEVERRLGPFGTWQVCPHGERERCRCRKPAPGLVERAAAALGVAPEACVVIGDTGADVEAATAAGARAILVPTERTLAGEIRHAWRTAEVARSLPQAVGRLLRS